MNKMMLAALAATALTGVAHAQNPIVIRPGTAPQAVTLSNGANTFAYNNPSGNTGSGTVTGDRPYAAPGTPGATGSLRITGDRSRYVIGSEFDAASLFLLDELGSLSFNYRVDNNGSPNSYNTPVVRVHVIDPGAPSGDKARSSITWEGIYNGTSNDEGLGWKSGDDQGNFFINVAMGGSRPLFASRNPGYTTDGSGVVMFGGAQYEGSLSDVKSLYSENAYVTGFSFGAGSGFGLDFVGYIDNVRFDINPITLRAPSTTNVVNFELAAAQAVPEPATWALLIVGFGMAGAAIRARKPAHTVA